MGVHVLGVDLSQNMLDIAYMHNGEMPEKVQNLVQFRYLDATQACFPENYFDVVYSRDAIMHIADKEPLYEKILTWLKPGGSLLNSEYVHGRNHPNLSRAKPPSREISRHQIKEVLTRKINLNLIKR